MIYLQTSKIYTGKYINGAKQSPDIELRGLMDDDDGVERTLTSSAVDINMIKERSSRISTT
jgi:hypothetical protein